MSKSIVLVLIGLIVLGLLTTCLSEARPASTTSECLFARACLQMQKELRQVQRALRESTRVFEKIKSPLDFSHQ